MDSIPEPETQPRDCDACVSNWCGVKFPAEFQGKYFRCDPNYEEIDGALCILHYRDAARDAARCAAAIERKKQAGDFNFRGVLFCGAVEFKGLIENADFSNAIFSGETDFRGATFSGVTHFNSAAFSDVVYFNNATFYGLAHFSGATFNSVAHFNSAAFNPVALFNSTTFNGAADFTHVKFSGVAQFDRTRFLGAARFFIAMFSGKADFTIARFNGDANFFGVRFCSAADFSNATFSNTADFGGATFSSTADFSAVAFKDRILFTDLAKERNEHGERTRDEVELVLIWATFGQPEKVLFRNVNLSETRFLHVDLRRLCFANVIWPPVLLDERKAKEKDYPHLEAIYRQLRQNYEEGRNYPDAGHFYYGEMQMRRKSLPWLRRYLLSLTTLYWLSNGYSQRPARAFAWIGVLFLFFTGLYKLGGLQLQPSYSGPVTHATGAALLHCAEVLTFARERTYAPASPAWGWVSVAQTMVMPLQLALFALAVRRKFQR